jgi:glycosyltransferase involved in cell wall biosynthesis
MNANCEDCPLPASGLKGWPWTLDPASQDAGRFSDLTSPAQGWPRITVVTPSYNQSAYLEETIRSVLMQQYPNLEYIVIDDGSTDNSVEIIRKYEPWLAYWTTGPNRGQSHVINKGFQRATGEILAWLNSDDCYEPGVLKTVANNIGDLRKQGLLMGDVTVFGGLYPRHIQRNPTPSFNELLYQFPLHAIRGKSRNPCQPAVFWHRKVLEKTGLLNEGFRYCMDYEFFMRALLDSFSFVHVPMIMANVRFHVNCKSMQGYDEYFGPEWRSVFERSLREISALRRLEGAVWWLFECGIPWRVWWAMHSAALVRGDDEIVWLLENAQATGGRRKARMLVKAMLLTLARYGGVRNRRHEMGKGGQASPAVPPKKGAD